MSHVYLIGGAPRVGKSTLAGQLAVQTGFRRLSTDDLRTHLRAITTITDSPDLFYLDSLNANEGDMARRMLDDVEDLITAAEREAAAVWPLIETSIRQHAGSGHGLIIEGVALLPTLISRLTVPVSAIILGNTSPTNATFIHEAAADDPWLRRLQPATIDAFAYFTRAQSHRLATQAATAHLSYLDLGQATFTAGLQQAAQILRGQ